MVMVAGTTSFAVGYILLHFVLPVGAWVTSVPEPMVSAFAAGLVAILAMAATVAVLARKLHVYNLRMRVAINNMSQGLCMFDAHERLVVCNKRYMEMYNISADIVKPGCSLQSLLEYRIRNKTFSRDPTEYRRNLLGAMTAGRTTATEVKSVDGRSISIINRPMAGGGWVATHERHHPAARCRTRTHFHAGAATAACRDRSGNRRFPPTGRGSPEDRDRRRQGDAIDRRYAVQQFGPDLQQRRWRGVRLE
jgi:PAS domain-containing protein